ncbi:MAG: helicase-related protein [Desulfovibrionaceae bacterium]|nr:helicase-related protein [Desulfovibrionaceae bacterium]
MARLEELVAGSSVLGILPREAVTVVAATWYGNAVLDLTYRDSRGATGSRLLYREDESSLTIRQAELPWSFDADGAQLRLAAEAWRIHYAHLFDPYLAVHTSDVEPLPHQISAVYQELLGRLPLRYILADDPGAGKTIMTGLFIRELMARGDLRRCLIVCPGSLAEQWQDELFRKFHLRFEILNNERIEAAVSGNIFQEAGLAIARLDKLARNDHLQDKLRVTDWDLIVCDEAHKMSARVWGGDVHMTRRYQLGRLLSGITRHFLLLTATPHNGKEEDFQLFLALVDQDRFGGAARTGAQSVQVSDVMRRLVKEDLLKFDGSRLFPERHAATVDYSLSPQEAELYQAVTEYVENEFNRADKLAGERSTTVGFALTVLQRRLASSPEAIYQSLRRRRERLERRLEEERLGRRARSGGRPEAGLSLAAADFDEDDLPAAELEEAEEQVADRASAASTAAELEAEIATLKRLEDMAAQVRASGGDRKWEELSALLQDERCMFDADGVREKLIIFTEHRDTLRYLAGRIRSLLGSEDAVVVIDGGMLRDERRKVEERFRQDGEVRILVATDAAGEGLNLQRAHLMVNYDLPWNPNRLEQRFGRIHRIGQTRECWLWNLVAAETREGKVFKTLFEKLEQERQALGGKVFDILGKVTFNNRPLRELLIEAVRHGQDPDVQTRLDADVAAAFDGEALRRLLREHALTQDVMDAHAVAAIREDMERMEARRLQPHFIEAFFREAFSALGGRMAPREKGRFEISFVPHCVRSRDSLVGAGDPVLPRYERVCFDKAGRSLPGAAPAALICPGHPLLEAVGDVLRERAGDLLKRGAVLVDESDAGTAARLLFFIEHSIQDGTLLPDGRCRTVSRRMHFVELGEDGTASGAGTAPYLDYRPASEEERQAALAHAAGQAWLAGHAEGLALSHAVTQLIPGHLSEVRARREALLDRTEKAVRERLTAEIRYWDYRAADLRLREQADKRNSQLNANMAERRAEELAARLKRRMDELAAERSISALPPVVMGGALIIPAGLAARLTGRPLPAACADAEARRATELAAMQAVMAVERQLGFLPRDVSAARCGYDIESAVPDALERGLPSLRFIEVKGRAAGADTVIVTRNEILTALNQPEQFLLALVEVDGPRTRTIYLKRPFVHAPDFSAEGCIFNIAALLEQAEIVYGG